MLLFLWQLLACACEVACRYKKIYHILIQALSRYCRIIIQYLQGNEGNFLLANETFPLDNDAKAELHNIVDKELGLYKLIGEVDKH